MAKVYLSPAYHKFNPCSIDGCDETTHNNLYMDEVEKFLTACGIEWKRGPRRVPKSAEDGNVLMRQAVAEANEWGCDIYYVSHTNASTNLSDGVGNGKAKGCRPIIYEGSARGEALGEIMVRWRKMIYEGDVRLNRRTDLYELRVPYAVSFYEEHVFHDNLEDAQWFHANLRNIARNAVQAMCEYLGVEFVDPYESTIPDGYEAVLPSGDLPRAEHEALEAKYNALKSSAESFCALVGNGLSAFSGALEEIEA